MAESIIRSPVFHDLKGDDFLSRLNLQFEKVLDTGMCGEIVLTALPHKPDIKCVVKKFSLSDKDMNLRNRQFFEQEVSFMQSFDHRFIMKCVIAFESPEILGICLPFYKRGTLHDNLGSVDLVQAEICVAQVACALRYLHKNNVAHLDVKLDNIFLDVDFEATLGDFGLAVIVPKDQRTVPSLKCGGTPGYFAPERLAASEYTELDPYKMDSYSLGVVLWALVFEKYPEEKIHYFFEAHKKRDLPYNARRWLLKLLVKDPGARMSINEFLDSMRREAGLRRLIEQN